MSLRYNVGSLASVGSEGEHDTTGKLVPAINRGNWDRAELEALIKNHYNSNKNENNKKGWLDGADKMLDVFLRENIQLCP